MSEEDKKEIVPGSDEYNEMMAAKFREGKASDAQTQETPPVPEMPENGQEKFYNAETGEYDWANHAKELQYRIDQSNKGEKPEGNEPPPQSEEEAAESIIDKAGLSMDGLAGEITKDGQLSEDSLKALKAQGIPQELIDGYVENFKLAQEAATKTSLDYVGGQEEWNKINAWAKENLTGSEREFYNQALNSDQWMGAVDTLKQKMAAKSPTGGEGKLETGGSPNVPSVGYEYREQMVTDMQDPRYKTDPKFRQEVMVKIQNKKF